MRPNQLENTSSPTSARSLPLTRDHWSWWLLIMDINSSGGSNKRGEYTYAIVKLPPLDAEAPTFLINKSDCR
jgi:hypothetical protein